MKTGALLGAGGRPPPSPDRAVAEGEEEGEGAGRGSGEAQGRAGREEKGAASPLLRPPWLRSRKPRTGRGRGRPRGGGFPVDRFRDGSR